MKALTSAQEQVSCYSGLTLDRVAVAMVFPSLCASHPSSIFHRVQPTYKTTRYKSYIENKTMNRKVTMKRKMTMHRPPQANNTSADS